MPAARYHPRPEGEWQGMLVDLAIQPPCERSEQCGMARACVGGRCAPCTSDSDCAAAEVCVLDHCVLRIQANCRVRKDCRDEDAMCVLSGYTAAPRGNEKTRADCISSRGGTPFPSSQPPPSAAYGGNTSEGDRLLEELRDARKTRAK
jgi:hypothetical protein